MISAHFFLYLSETWKFSECKSETVMTIPTFRTTKLTNPPHPKNISPPPQGMSPQGMSPPPKYVPPPLPPRYVPSPQGMSPPPQLYVPSPPKVCPLPPRYVPSPL